MFLALCCIVTLKSLTVHSTDILYPEHPISPGNSDLPVTPLTSSMHGASQDYIRGIHCVVKWYGDLKVLYTYIPVFSATTD